MDNPRTLPPLIRGKVKGIFDFFIDEVVLRRNVSHLTEELDIIVQVQWWGETLPAFIRPSVLKLQNGISKTRSSVETCNNSVRYEIKTTMGLLKSYMKACEALELTVYEAVKNHAIGSAFLKNLCNLLHRNNDFIFIPIFDHLGEDIGEMRIHAEFFEYPQTKENHSTCRNKTSDKKFDALEAKISELLKTNDIFAAEKTVFYDGYSNRTNIEIKSDDDLEFEKLSMKDRHNALSLDSFNFASETDLCNKLNHREESSIGTKLPVVSVFKDSSKILNFDLGLKTEKSEINKKSKPPNKFTSSSIKCKSKQKPEKPNREISTKKETCVKKTVLQNVVDKNSDVTVTNNVGSKKPSRQQSKESFSSKNSESISQGSTNKMVFDYLLGTNMSKENEESALKDFKEMSPSCDIVSTINELCLPPKKISTCSINYRKRNLYFDLTNPIERSYYKKFFVNNDSNDFEIAELLNEPQNKYALQKQTQSERYTQNDGFRVQKDSVTRKYVESPINNLNNVDKIMNDCNRCKYSKKLDELDTIIESLKHFEKNVLKQERKLQLDFETNLNKQGCNVTDERR